MAGQLVIVKRMHGLSVLFHHIVGYVHDVVDRTDPAGSQTALHPPGGRGKPDVLDHPCTVTRAKPAVFNAYLQVIINILIIAGLCD